ncbi:hypothetical protein [Sphingobium yanoikuyae]|uniref:hypothetical protein n=1 Tax=Sphingobium yanoikuyae TaxID=13690 RepID=UPI0026E9BE78|nr:hypothetical protein [Sphingobium yanoikuyae]
MFGESNTDPTLEARIADLEAKLAALTSAQGADVQSLIAQIAALSGERSLGDAAAQDSVTAERGGREAWDQDINDRVGDIATRMAQGDLLNTEMLVVRVQQAENARDITLEARDQAESLVATAMLGDPYPTVEAGLADTAVGDEFVAYGPPPAYGTRYRHAAGDVAQEIAAYPSVIQYEAAMGEVDATATRLAEQRAQIAAVTTFPIIWIGARRVEITAASFDLNSVQAKWMDTGLPYFFGGSPDGETIFPDTVYMGRPFRVLKVSLDLVLIAGKFLDTGAEYPSRLPVTTFMGRPFEADFIGFDLVPKRGKFLDTGADYPGRLPETVFQGRPFDPQLISFDFVPYKGTFLDNAESYPENGGGGDVEVFLWPEMEVKFSAGRIDVYRRQYGNVYTRHTIVLTDRPDLNSSVWHTREIWDVTRSQAGAYTQVMRIFRPGEVELAIYFQNPDRANAIGGDAHGNEEMVSFAAMVDGVIVDHAVAGTYSCSQFEMFQRSTGFLPGTANAYVPKGPAIFDIYKRWYFTPGADMRLDNYLVPLLAGYQCKVGYPTMAPMERVSAIDNVTVIASAARRAPKFLPESVALGDPEILDLSDNIKVYGARYSTEVKVLEGWDNPDRQMRVKLDDADYAKIYVNAWRNKVTVIGEPWICSAIITVRISEGATA